MRKVTRREMLLESAAVGFAASRLSASRGNRAKLRVCVLDEPGLPREDAPENLMSLLQNLPNAEVIVRDAATIAREGIDASVFCNSHGSAYPEAIGDKVYEFIAGGGSLLHVGGVPFGRAYVRKDAKWTLDEKSGTTLREKLGIHVYGPAFPIEGAPAMQQTFDPALIGLPSSEENLPKASVDITTTLPLQVADPALFGIYSITYLAKPVCRHTHIAGQLEGPDRKPILSSILFTKTWRNPYSPQDRGCTLPWAICTSSFTGAISKDLFSKLWAWISRPAYLGAIDLDRATLRPGEEATVTAPIFGVLPPGWKASAQACSVTLEGWKAGKTPQWRAAKVETDAPKVSVLSTRRSMIYAETSSEVSAQVQDDGRAGSFLFCIRFQLVDDAGNVRDYSESAVVAWRPEALKSGPRLGRNRTYLDYSMDGHEHPASFQLGTNWQDSEVYGLTWHNPNPLRMAADARSMAEQGLRIMRVHYVMPEFLRVLAADVFRNVDPEFYRSFEPGPELTERHLRALEAHAMVFGRLGIVLMPSVYTCVGPSMGNCQMWTGTSERFEIPDMVEAQKVFARQVMDRVGSLPSISWDLINEPDVALSKVGQWFDGMKSLWTRTGQLAGIGTSGLEQNLSLGQSSDWHAVHANCSAMVDAQVFRTGKPHLFHEAWVHTESTPDGEIEVEKILSQTIARTIVRGGCGFMPWNWNKLLAYWRYGGSETEVGDLTLGACANGTGVRRRGWFALRNWARLLDGVSFDQTLAGQIIYVYPRLTITGDRPQLWVEALWARNLPCIGINDREFAEADLSGAKLIVVPHYGKGYRGSTYQRIMKFAEGGGVVWAHADSLRRDEEGSLAPGRSVQFTNARVALGGGAIEWYFGWSVPTKWESGTSSHRFEQVLRGINWQRPAQGVMPLAIGELRFHGDKELKEIRTVQIVDKSGTVTRAWSGLGDPLTWLGLALSSPGQLFSMRVDPNTFHVYGERVRVESSASVSVTLPDFPRYSLTKREENGSTVVELQNWQRGHWFDLHLG
jgi:hypothetical protein